MSEGIILPIIALLYTGSTAALFYVNQHFFISKKAIRQVVNWPLAKVRDAIVTSILRLISEENIFSDERDKVEEFYDTILMKINEENRILRLERLLKNIRKLSMINIVLPFLSLFPMSCYVFHSCKPGWDLLSIVQRYLNVLIILWILPWVFFFALYFCAENCKARLDAMEPRNTQERDEE